jgi:dUTP pyrophosphatase
MIDVKIKRATEPTPAWPSYATPLSAGADVRSKIDTIVPAHGRVLIPTGIFVAIPEGYEIQVRPRSGLALKKGITVLNTPGTIDADYRNEIGVILFNTTDEDFVVNAGDRIAQIVLTKFEQINWVEVDELDETERTDGFGHTGLK